MIRKIFLLLLVAATSQLYGTYPFGGSQFGTHPYGTQAALPPQYTPAGPAGAAVPHVFSQQPDSITYAVVDLQSIPEISEILNFSARDESYRRVAETKRGLYWARLAQSRLEGRPQPVIQEADVEELAVRTLLKDTEVALILRMQQMIAYYEAMKHEAMKSCVLPAPYARGSAEDPVCGLPEFKSRLSLLPEAQAEYENDPPAINDVRSDMGGLMEYLFLAGRITYPDMLCLDIHNKFGEAAKPSAPEPLVELPDVAPPAPLGALQCPDMPQLTPGFLQHCRNHPKFLEVAKKKFEKYQTAAGVSSLQQLRKRTKEPRPFITEAHVKEIAKGLNAGYRDVAGILVIQLQDAHAALVGRVPFGSLPPKEPDSIRCPHSNMNALIKHAFSRKLISPGEKIWLEIHNFFGNAAKHACEQTSWGTRSDMGEMGTVSLREGSVAGSEDGRYAVRHTLPSIAHQGTAVS